MAKTALVLGATGMVGHPLALSLIEDGWEVHGAARFSGDITRKFRTGKASGP